MNIENNRTIGFFIVLDGEDASGKSTQIKLLKSRLEKIGYNVITTREPGGTIEAEKIRNLIVTDTENKWDTLSELFLLLAARRNHIETLIKPSLKEGNVVLCDRFSASTIAYQGFGRGLDISIIRQALNLAIGNFIPDLTLLLTATKEERLHRLQNRGNSDRFESMGNEFYDRVSFGYEYASRVQDLVGPCVKYNTTPKENETVDHCITRVEEDLFGIIKSYLNKSHRYFSIIDH